MGLGGSKVVVQGTVAPGYESVKDLFQANFEWVQHEHDDIGGDSVYCGGQYLYLFGDNDDNNEKLWWMIKIHIEPR